jgi:hypothetical protein
MPLSSLAGAAAGTILTTALAVGVICLLSALFRGR